MTRRTPARGPTDSQVIERSLAEPEAFSELFERHHRAIYGYLARKGAGTEAEDLTSEVFLRSFAVRNRFDLQRDSARPWLFGFARNVWLSHIRDKRPIHLVPVGEEDVVSVDHSLEVACAIDAQVRLSDPLLAEAIDSLDVSIRETLLMYALDDLTYHEIAESLGVPLGTVRSRLGRARAAIRKRTTGTQDPATDSGDWNG